MSIRCVRCTTDEQDLDADRLIQLGLSVLADQIYLDRECSGSNGPRPDLDNTLAELFKVSRPSMYQVLECARAASSSA